MTCYTPLKAVRDHESGAIIFGDCQDGNPLYLPCGRCIGCRKDLTRDWAVRCHHEAQMHEHNCVLTLTFDENNLNAQNTLVKDDIRNFVKRLRKYIFTNKDLKNNFPRLYRKKISYLYCGEYGERFGRPHYHIIIFGFDFYDKEYLKDSQSSDPLYTSNTLDKIWGLGHCTIGTMSMASATYCASYLTKFTPTNEREEIYCGREPEFGHASKNPAIGLNWFKKYHKDITANDCIIIENQKYRIPRYYLKTFEKLSDPEFIKFQEKHKLTLPREIITNLKIRREEKIDKTSPDWNNLSNKMIVALEKYKHTDTIKSSDNKKRSEYLKNVLYQKKGEFL